MLFFCGVRFAYAEYITTNVQNGCNGTSKYTAVFTPNEYTCAPGYYLPANAVACVACPVGYSCDGGTYNFNMARDQGIKYSALIKTNVANGCVNNLVGGGLLRAVFTPSQYTCAPGYYLPANTDGCVICPANSYCVGGTYTFDETTTQGIETCPNSWYSPRGMSSADQCGRILHIGENVIYLRNVKKTSPSLHVRVDGYTFYGNMTTADVPMNANTNVHMKVQFNNETYSIYDDTVVWE